jgi:hypothetical protein
VSTARRKRRLPSRARRSAPNGIENIDGVSLVLYRSVSPEELADIFATGRITGRGNTFSGDGRDMVFFGEASVEDVLSQGEDTLRAASTDPKHAATRARMQELDDEVTAAHRTLKALYARHGIDPHDYSEWEHPKAVRDAVERLERTLKSASAAYDRVQRPWLRKVEAEAAKLRERDRKRYGATSFVVELHNVPDGVRFTDADSYHQTAEVGFRRPRGPNIGDALGRIKRVWPVLDGRKLPALTADAAARIVLKHRKALA